MFQALKATLGGRWQTIPRRELMAKYRTIVHGRSPQLVVSDHLNHVRSLIQLARGYLGGGKLHPLHPMSPDLDVRRMIVAAIQKRGGAFEDGLHMLWYTWQKSHTRATLFDSTEKKEYRCGNSAADRNANEGRQLHSDVSDKLQR